MTLPFKIIIQRTGDIEGFPLIPGNLPFSKIKSSEYDNRNPFNDAKPEAYVIDNDTNWNLILDRIKSNSGKSPIPPIDFNNNTLLAYFFGTTGSGGNKYKIRKIEGVPNTSTISMTIEFVGGPLDSVTSPYIIISIPKTSYKTVIFEVVEGKLESDGLHPFENS